MPYTSVGVFRGAKSFSKKVWKPLNFMKKWVKNNHSRLFLLSFNSKLNHFDKKSQISFTNLEKTDMIFAL
jgi:hypothetical protein